MSRSPYPAESSGSESTQWNQIAHRSRSYYGPSASFFDHAEHTTITNSQFQTTITQVQACSTGLKDLVENSAPGAVYNSLERQQLDAPKCHPNTRVAVINRIIDWLLVKIEFDALILWLYGAAGAGKSAIAHSIAEICEERGWLLATFFFWKSAAERNNITRFIATVAYQLARAIPTSRPYIEAAVEANPMIFHQSVDVQLAKLVIDPLQHLHSIGFDFKDSPFVIIIDGLDECQGMGVQSGLVKLLVTAFCHSPLCLRILIASRPEIYLQSTFNSSTLQPRLSRLALSDEYSAEEDIHQFLEDSFDQIRREHPLASYIPSSWPSAKTIHQLALKSSGQFIFASTSIKYIGGDPYELPTRRLDVICRLQPPRGEEDLPYVDLNSLYNHVLSNVRNIEKIKQVLGALIIVQAELPFPICWADKMDDLLLLQPGETRACLSQLASLIECNTVGQISILHASFSDFLLDPSRSRHFYLCRESILGHYTALGLHHMCQQDLKKDDFDHYYWFTINCLGAGPLCTPRLRSELGHLSLKNLYRVCEMHQVTGRCWALSSMISEMLLNQNLEDKFPHIISNLPSVFFEAFQKPYPDHQLSVLVYEVHYPHVLQLEASNPASVFPLNVIPSITPQIRHIIRRIATLHPEKQRLDFTDQHYTIVAKHFMLLYLRTSCHLNVNEFDKADRQGKAAHSYSLVAMSCITHVLPLSCKDIVILRLISFRGFHRTWNLDGWNDYIIQPARDAVLNYYKQYAEPSDVEYYMRHNNLE